MGDPSRSSPSIQVAAAERETQAGAPVSNIAATTPDTQFLSSSPPQTPNGTSVVSPSTQPSTTVVYAKEDCTVCDGPHQALLAAVDAATVQQLPLSQVVDKCVDIYMEYSFALLPVLHEPTLRAHTVLEPPSHVDESCTRVTQQMVDGARNYCLMTILFAITCQVAPVDVLPYGKDLTPFFALASEAGQKALYASHEISDPTATSLVIRICRSSYHHLNGDANLAWHFMDQAMSLAQVMRLHDEHS